MKKISKILVIVLILSVMMQIVSASSSQDYTCVNKVTDKVPPPLPTSVKIDENMEKTSLCPAGQVPVSSLKFSEKYTSDTNLPTKESSEASCISAVCYDWVYSRQYVTGIGMSAYLTQHSPAIDLTNGIYSAANIYTTDGSNRVLIGWKKYANDVTRLDTSWWRYNTLQDCGYAGCDFVQVSNSYYPGMYLGENNYGVFYEILYSGGDWWLNYNGEWIGYYPDYLWGYGFTYGSENIYRGAVASLTSVSTTDMGNGLWSSNVNAANIFAMKYQDAYSGYWYDAYTTKTATTSSMYSFANTGSNSMRYGGPGSTGTSPSITVTSPNGGESWTRGTSKTITWAKTGSPGANVKIELLKGTAVNRVILSSTPNDGSQTWAIPATQTLGIDYKIRITSTTNSAYKDTSNNNFAINSGGTSIRVVSPNGGESWARGSTKLITWTYTGSPGANVRIQLYKGSVLVRTISSGTSNDGSFSWPIPWTQAIGSDYKIKISSTTSSYNDWSNSNFRIY